MHFRLRKNVIQLIRIDYDGAKKKGVNTVVGTVQLADPVIPEALRVKLTVDELAAFEAWVNTQHRANCLREEMAALTLAETMALAEKWFAKAGNSNAAQFVAQDIMSQWHSLRRQLTKNNLLD